VWSDRSNGVHVSGGEAPNVNPTSGGFNTDEMDLFRLSHNQTSNQINVM